MARSSLKDETEVSLAGVLRLCNGNGGITREDFDAVERHDETTLALLEVNEEDTMKVMVVV